MNCPYCKTHIPGMTGYQEADNFRQHLNRCRKSPALNAARVLAGTNWHVGRYKIDDALEIRAASGQ